MAGGESQHSIQAFRALDYSNVFLCLCGSVRFFRSKVAAPANGRNLASVSNHSANDARNGSNDVYPDRHAFSFACAQSAPKSLVQYRRRRGLYPSRRLHCGNAVVARLQVL